MNAEQLQQKFPFLTGVKHCDTEYVGIVQNQDETNFCLYDIERAGTIQEKQRLLEIADTWWWESNRQIPIDVFMFTAMLPYRHCLRVFTHKDLTVLFGPTVSMNNLLKKRIKRRSIQLIKRVD